MARHKVIKLSVDVVSETLSAKTRVFTPTTVVVDSMALAMPVKSEVSVNVRVNALVLPRYSKPGPKIIVEVFMVVVVVGSWYIVMVTIKKIVLKR